MGFFTDTTVCIGCKACEVACKQWNDLPSDGGEFVRRRLLRPHARAQRLDVAPRPLRRARRERSRPVDFAHHDVDLVAAAEAVPAAVRRLRRLGLHVRRLQALHERRLPRRVPDRRARAHGVRDRRAPARRLQRLRLLHPGVPVRRRRPRPGRRPRRQVHALLRPPRGRAGARVREGCPTDSIQFGAYDELLDVAAAARGHAARSRRRGRLPLRRARRARRGSSPAASARSSCSPSRRSATGCPRRPTRRSRRTCCPRPPPRSAPGCSWRGGRRRRVRAGTRKR